MCRPLFCIGTIRQALQKRTGVLDDQGGKRQSVPRSSATAGGSRLGPFLAVALGVTRASDPPVPFAA